MTSHLPPSTIYTADMGALTLLISSWAGWLPAIAAGLAAVWYAIQIWDRFFNKG